MAEAVVNGGCCYKTVAGSLCCKLAVPRNGVVVVARRCMYDNRLVVNYSGLGCRSSLRQVRLDTHATHVEGIADPVGRIDCRDSTDSIGQGCGVLVRCRLARRRFD